MSTIEVNKIAPVSGGTNVTLGDSGDTFTIPSGVTMTNNGSSSGFAPAGISSASTSGTALQITSGNIIGAGSDATNADLGVGIHIKTADSGASVDGAADELVVETSGHGGITILTGNAHEGRINFGDNGDNNSGFFSYDHSANAAFIGTGGNNIAVKIDNSGVMAIGTTSISGSPNTSCLELKGTEAPLSIINETAVDSGDRTSIAFRNAAGTLVGNVGVDNASTIFNTSSDYRLKENEVAISDGIERLKQLKPYKFNFKIQADKTVDGFFAHEVSSIVPEAITGEKDATETYTDDNGDEQTRIKPQGIDQSKLVPLLTAALKEAITKIETLEAKVAALESA